MKRALALVLIAIAACGGGGDDAPAPTACGTPLPGAELSAGERYFRLDGRSRFLLSRNLTGTEEQVLTLIERTAAAGSKLVRVHVTHGRGMGIRSDGSADAMWVASWERTFDAALRCGLYVMPVFGVWADFNDGTTPNFGFANWHNNPLSARGTPSDLYVDGSAVQTAWLAWIRQLALRWQERPNILAWEVFSELDLVSRATEAAGVEFVRRARAVLRTADARERPVTASVAGIWPTLSDAIDFVQLHRYGEHLDTFLIDQVRLQLGQHAKGVLIGESGLSALPPDGNTATTAPNAPIATRHAGWAAMVAGAMNGRALWWEDAYALFHAPGIGFVDRYPDVERGVAKLAASRDVSGHQPIDLILPSDVIGAAIGSESAAVGWVRSAGCASPNWVCTLPRGDLRLTVRVPGTHPSWTVQMVDTLSGEPKGSPQDVDRSPEGVEIVLPPDFADDAAFTLDVR